MVKIAVAGGTGSLAREIIEVLIETHKHEILVLSRKDPSTAEGIPGVTLVKADYKDTAQLAEIFGGVHTVLSFIAAHDDPDSAVHKALIDAAITAGVKRFAPSEWATSNREELPWYAGKAVVQSYLEEVNKDDKVLEYALFQPGLLVDYFVPPGAATKYFQHVELPIDFANRRAITLEGVDSLVTLTTVSDLANVVALAIEYPGEWPIIGGIRGTTLPTSKVLEIGAKVRGGKPFDVTALKEEDVRAGQLKSSWLPNMSFPNLPQEQTDFYINMFVKGSLLCGIHASWAVSDEWNRLLPDYKFEDTEAFLSKHWEGKP